MKKEITDRIRLLGGNVANLKGNSLKEDLCAITFDTALFLKPVDTPWLAAEDTEPIEGLGDCSQQPTLPPVGHGTNVPYDVIHALL